MLLLHRNEELGQDVDNLLCQHLYSDLTGAFRSENSSNVKQKYLTLQSLMIKDLLYFIHDTVHSFDSIIKGFGTGHIHSGIFE
jgi:hypothetical protein